MLLDITEGIKESAYNIVAVFIFAFVSYTFLFPCNSLIPLDRRTIAVVGAIACYLMRTFLFPSQQMDMLEAIDFHVLILLASIMVINHIVVHLKETKNLIHYFQRLVQENPIRGYWAISFAAFIISPFLTNDGVCLLFVEPIIHAFEETLNTPHPGGPPTHTPHPEDFGQESANASSTLQIDSSSPIPTTPTTPSKHSKLEREDAFYFLVGLACSANLGSALTYTGNPQNMIVASDSIDVMPPYKFLLYMLIPTILCWYITTKWIERCWLQNKEEVAMEKMLLTASQGDDGDGEDEEGGARAVETTTLTSTHPNKEQQERKALMLNISTCECVTMKVEDIEEAKKASPLVRGVGKSARLSNGPTNQLPSVLSSPLSPRRQRARERDKLVKRVVKVVSSPIPYIILVLLLAMIVMIFVDIMPISSLICVVAITMVLVVVIGNHWQNALIWEEDPQHHHVREMKRRNTRGYSLDSVHPPTELGPLTREDRLDNLNEFFEDLFNSIDYSLLLIFLGTFIVVENMASTGIPKYIWKQIVGPQPFQTFLSIAGISGFILIASQLLGNVAVIQLAKPNVHDLEDNSKRLAWAVISFIATIGGNLTITGSAANIIVAEKANRLDPTIAMNFYRHYQVCFWITLFCCIIGGSLLSAIVTIDNMINAS